MTISTLWTTASWRKRGPVQENITADISVELRSDRKLMVMVAVIRVNSVLTLVQTQLVGLSGGEVLGSCL